MHDLGSSFGQSMFCLRNSLPLLKRRTQLPVHSPAPAGMKVLLSEAHGDLSPGVCQKSCISCVQILPHALQVLETRSASSGRTRIAITLICGIHASQRQNTCRLTVPDSRTANMRHRHVFALLPAFLFDPGDHLKTSILNLPANSYRNKVSY